MLCIDLSPLDSLWTLHGSFSIPLSHVTNAFVSDKRALELKLRLLGTSLPKMITAGIFTSPDGLVFCDIGTAQDCLVISTRNEQFTRIATEGTKCKRNRSRHLQAHPYVIGTPICKKKPRASQRKLLDDFPKRSEVGNLSPRRLPVRRPNTTRIIAVVARLKGGLLFRHPLIISDLDVYQCFDDRNY